ncbi:MAG TPA: sigma-70 region 4 domain-containing protein, partial [Solirubrobacter sp.]
ARNVLLVSVRRRALEARARERLGVQVTPVSVSPQEAWLERLDDEDVPEAVRLRVVDEKDYDEIARELGTTPGAARVRVHRGLAALRKERTR